MWPQCGADQSLSAGEGRAENRWLARELRAACARNGQAMENAVK